MPPNPEISRLNDSSGWSFGGLFNTELSQHYKCFRLSTLQSTPFRLLLAILQEQANMAIGTEAVNPILKTVN